MGKITGFLEYTRTEAPHREVAERIRDFEPLLLPCDASHIHIQSARCMDCGVPFCHAGMQVENSSIGCPLGNPIPETNDLAYRGKWDDAFLRLSLTHPFPEITGRVCPALCEGSCTVGQHGNPVAVRDIERTLADYALHHELSSIVPSSPTGKTVAVVGSGPSGLACADMLSRKGHSVTVFERDDRPGGFLMYGIPNMKLAKSVIDHRIRLLEKQKIIFRTGCEVGTSLPAEVLLSEFDAVVLCTGSRQARRLSTPGADAAGIIGAIDYLTAATRKLLNDTTIPQDMDAAGKDVVVVGGGDTGTDCIATAIRQGAASVASVEIMPPLPAQRADNNCWPLYPRVKKTDYGHQEAFEVFGHDIREYNTTVKEILTQKGTMSGIATVEVAWQQNAAGLLVPNELPKTIRTRDASLVLVAMGFTGTESLLPEKMQLRKTAQNTIETSEGDSFGRGGFQTCLPGVFAAGDARRGPSLVVWAIQEGMRAAGECHKYLQAKK